MRLTFKNPAEESISFHTDYINDMSRKIMPVWLRESLGVLFLAAIFATAIWFTDALDRAVPLTIAVWAVHWLWQKGYAFVRRKMTARYLASLPDAGINVVEVSEERIVSECRGLRYSFPLTALTHIYEKKEHLYLDFATLGRIRIPFRAFESSDDRFQFCRLLDEKRMPNQSSKPTLAVGQSG